MVGITVTAPAKLNLFLHVLGQREDGFHELQTVFQFLDFGDELRITSREDGEIRRTNDVEGVPDSEDLALRAAHALAETCDRSVGCDIDIDKRVPMGGGLGGGSSNAASTLLALNKLWELGLSKDRLADIGLGLGADVPVFIHGQAAWAEGVGEKLTPIELPEPWYLVITPDCVVNTRELYAAPELRRNAPRITPEDFRNGQCGNDFEPVARARFPPIAAALDWLKPHSVARLTGSGASVFAAFESESAARAIARRVPERWRNVVARGCNRSPLRVA